MARGLAGEDVGTRRLSETPDCHPSPYLGEWKKLWGMVCKSKNLGSLKALRYVHKQGVQTLILLLSSRWLSADCICEYSRQILRAVVCRSVLAAGETGN